VDGRSGFEQAGCNAVPEAMNPDMYPFLRADS
jgi:hypothetical protein